MKVLVLHHPYDRPRFEQDMLNRIAERPAFSVMAADLAALAEGRLASNGTDVSLAGHDAVVLFVAFNRLRQAPAIDWQGYSGLRVLFDHDVIQSYSDLWDRSLIGAWPPTFRRHRFDLLLTSGRAVRDRLAAEGIAADWLPKGFEATRFSNAAGARSGVITYGSAYRSRVIAERALASARIKVKRISLTPYETLGAVLNRYLAALAISAELRVPFAVRRYLDHVPPALVPMRPGLEPMAKLYEVAGAGCCPVIDDMAELAAQGFIDGKTAITFRSFAELTAKLKDWMTRPEELRELGCAAAALAHGSHTWQDRARELENLLVARLRG